MPDRRDASDPLTHVRAISGIDLICLYGNYVGIDDVDEYDKDFFLCYGTEQTNGQWLSI